MLKRVYKPCRDLLTLKSPKYAATLKSSILPTIEIPMSSFSRKIVILVLAKWKILKLLCTTVISMLPNPLGGGYIWGAQPPLKPHKISGVKVLVLSI